MDESSILAKFDAFVQSGAVLFDDQQQIIDHVDGELQVRFLLTDALAQKPTLQSSTPGNNTTQAELRDGSDICTTGFEIADVDGTSHVLVANKFALARPHVLLLTQDGHRRQYEPLDEGDLAAAWAVLASLSCSKSDKGRQQGAGTGRDKYVAFFNCGRDGGCSRLHKHMQLLPTPAASLASFLDDDTGPDGEGEPPEVPFHWFYHRFASPDNNDITPTELATIYARLLDRAAAVLQGVGGAQHPEDTSLPGAAKCPHNVVLTRRWMLVVPRRRGAVQKGIAANAIGMLGVIPVASRDEMAAWVELGPARALSLLGVPR